MSIYIRLKKFKQQFYGFLQKNQVSRAKKKHLSSDWSLWDLKINKQGHMIFGGCDVVHLADRYGTPLHVVDKVKLISNYTQFARDLRDTGLSCHIHTSYKTNPIPAVLNELHKQGTGAEVISPYELYLAFRLGVDPDYIIYNGVNKSVDSLREAVQQKIKCININSFKEIDDIHKITQELSLPANVGARVCPSIGIAGQFGFKISTGEALQAFKIMKREKHFRIKMLHMHLGTGIKNISNYVQALREIFAFMAQLKQQLNIIFEYLDIGGGYGVSTVYYLDPKKRRAHRLFRKPYPGIHGRDAPSFEKIADVLGNTVRKECRKHGLEVPKIILEPGRILTSDTQILVGKIGDIKIDTFGFPIALCDVGRSSAHPLGSEYHEMLVANKAGEAERDFYIVVGPTCDLSDTLTEGKMFPKLHIGDYIVILDSGAYFTSFTYNFSFPRPAVVMAFDGKHHCIQRHETCEEMMVRDVING